MAGRRVRVKFCGMRSIDDVNNAVHLGADALGFIFYTKSSRSVNLEMAKCLFSVIPPLIAKVGVFVNPSKNEVNDILNELSLDYLQFHGDESADFCTQFNKPYIKAVAALSSIAIINIIDQHPDAGAILIDTPAATFGGTGTVFDWQLIPKNLAKPIILAGGLHADNIRQAIAKVGPYAVDVCSGIEQCPGVKDLYKMTNFIDQVYYSVDQEEF